MIKFAEISRILPMAIILVFAILAQPMAAPMPERDQAGLSTNNAVIICSNGKLLELASDSDGVPIGHAPQFVHCPKCVAVQKFTLPTLQFIPILHKDLKSETLKPVVYSELITSKIPEFPNRPSRSS